MQSVYEETFSAVQPSLLLSAKSTCSLGSLSSFPALLVAPGKLGLETQVLVLSFPYSNSHNDSISLFISTLGLKSFGLLGVTKAF